MIFDFFVLCEEPVDIADGGPDPDDQRPESKEVPCRQVGDFIGINQTSGQGSHQHKTHMPVQLSPDLIDDHTDAVDATPDDEVPTGAVP